MTSYFIYYYTMHCRLQVFEESALKAVTDFRKKKDVPEDRIADAAVSFDGTWAKRGHSSHYGVQALVLQTTGCVIDFNVFSNLCVVCDRMERSSPDTSSDGYRRWLESHSPHCRRNFRRSANAMEADGAVVLWQRSIAKYQLR